MKDTLKKFFSKKTTLVLFFLLVTALVTFQNIHLGVKHSWGDNFTHYNNYLIFKSSFSHLASSQNLYITYNDQYADLYKYSPTFALFMAPFSVLPDWLGLFLWNALNVFVLLFGILSVSKTENTNRLLLLLFILPELILSTQNSQSNALLCGLTLLAWSNMEKDRPQYATLFIVLSGFIKIFSFSACLLLLLYPKKIKSIAYTASWSLLLLALPLIVTSPSELIHQYQNWLVMLKSDHSASLGMSIYSYSEFLLPENLNKLVMLVVGVLLLLAPLSLFRKYGSRDFRFYYMTLLLLWVVIFNHKAESPTFIIAITGIALWGFHLPVTMNKKIILGLSFLLISVSSIFFAANLSVAMLYVKSCMAVVTFFIILFTLFRIEDKPGIAAS